MAGRGYASVRSNVEAAKSDPELSSGGVFRHSPGMEPSLTDTLCVGCGLCCDGTLFADVELAGRAEIIRLEVLGLEVEDDGSTRALLPQPCAALRGRRCRIYPHRPKCCRTFECQLLQEVRSGVVEVERAKERIAVTLEGVARVRELLRRLGQRDEALPLAERCAEALARDADPSPRRKRMRAELETVMAEVTQRIRKTFLGRGASS
jgi:Fe-S-cluster containining protein